MSIRLRLPDAAGNSGVHEMSGRSLPAAALDAEAVRICYSAAHVVCDPLADNNPRTDAAIDWDATLAFRRHLHSLGLGIAEAMDTAQRGMGLDWPAALSLIARTCAELPEARIASGAGTDQLDLRETQTLASVRAAWLEQIEAVQKAGSRVIVMASRALTRVAESGEDYRQIYADILSHCDEPVILHWLGDMFDPQLAGYWGDGDLDQASETCLGIIRDNASRIDGIKISLLDKHREIDLRRRLPAGVKMYTGDDFNYPELIAGDEQGYSHALLGIFDPLAAAAAHAVRQLGDGDVDGFHQTLDPTVPLARHIFAAPTQHYKTGVVFLAWLNGFQAHFSMIGGAQSDRSLMHLVEAFRLADRCGLLRDPALACERMQRLLGVYGFASQT